MWYKLTQATGLDGVAKCRMGLICYFEKVKVRSFRQLARVCDNGVY